MLIAGLNQPARIIGIDCFRTGFTLAFFGSSSEKRSPLLFNFGTPALGALLPVLLVFGERQNRVELLPAGAT